MANLICGFALNSVSELGAATGSPTISTSVIRVNSSGFSMRCNPTTATAFKTFGPYLDSTGAGIIIASSAKFYLRIASLPTANTIICSTGATANNTRVRLNTDGTLSILEGGGANVATSTLTLSADGLWHKISMSAPDAASTNRFLYVDGVLFATYTGGNVSNATSSIVLGVQTSCTTDLYFADLVAVQDLLSSADISSSPYYVKSLFPVADPVALNNWTDGGGGTTNLYQSLDNAPPTGAAASTNGTKIKNAANATGTYAATMQTYSAAGVPTGSIVNYVFAFCCHGEEVSTGTKLGSLSYTNPSSGTLNFNFGDDGGALGTYPTGWAWAIQYPTSTPPSVTLGTAPVLSMAKANATTRVVDICSAAMYVDFSPPPISTSKVLVQSVKRTSIY